MRNSVYNSQAGLEALTAEFKSVENRVRNLIGDKHWGTDGEWKESILRKMLRERLPRTLEVGRGFIVQGQDVSTQIDVLVVDAARPVFMRDGDLVFVGADAVVAAIEVKTDVTRWSEAKWSDELGKLSQVAALCASSSVENSRYLEPFVGLFAFHGSEKSGSRAINAAASARHYRRGAVNHIAVGSKYFARLETQGGLTDPQQWSLYRLEGMAFGYFLGNLLMWLDMDHVSAHGERYFPVDKSRQSLVSSKPIELHEEWCTA